MRSPHWQSLFSLLLLPTLLSAAEIDFAVMVSATTQESPAQITLSWPVTSTATEYRIARKLGSNFATNAWSTLATQAAGAGTLSSFTDSTAQVGVLYEYEVRRLRSGQTDYDYGYISAGIKLPIVENRGTLILIVDETMASPLATELAQLESDLAGDGWSIVRHDVARTTTVPSVKNLITTAYNADPANVKGVFLFGRVPVPYSGDIAPDGHSPDHKGAWPADCYYGDMNGSWTDTTVNTTTATTYGTRNHNVPGDGKFDQSAMPGSGTSRIELMVGRVDLSSLPAFTGVNETSLLRRYLNKSHTWKHGELTVNRRGLVDENFDLAEKTGAAGYRILGALFGSSNVSTLDYTTTLANQTYLVSYGDGAGSMTNCSGVVSTSNFATNDYRSVFTMLFGSYFGDWDAQDNLLRAAIASPTYTLVSLWGSRPYPLLHSLGMGGLIGEGVRITQNHSGNEGASDIYKPSYTTYYSFDYGPQLALMGDPSLRLHPVKPVTNPVLSLGSGQVTLTWSHSTDTGIAGYHIYRATAANGPFTRLTGTTVSTTNPTGSAISATSFIDNTAQTGTDYYYMIRAVKLETSNTGTYYNLSQGVYLETIPPVITPGQTVRGPVGDPLSYTILASGTPNGFTVVSGTLPPGLTLNSGTGEISGTPTTAGNFTVSFTATNGGGTSPSVSLSFTITAAGIIVSEGFDYPIGTNNPDPDGGLNSGNGLPANNTGGNPSGTSTGLRLSWGTTTDVVAGLTYSQGSKVLVTSGGAGRVNNATWGGQPYLYRNMTIDPFLSQRIGDVNTGNFGKPGTSLYVSLVGQTSSATADSFRLSFKYDGSANLFLSNTATGWSLNGTSAAGSPLVLNTPTLFVLRFDFNTTTTVSLWINPPLGGTLGTPNVVCSGLTFPGLSNFQTRSSVANTMTLDELRMGLSYASVTAFTETNGLASFRTDFGIAADGSEDGANPSGDGVANLLKYAFNMLGNGPGQATDLPIPNAAVLAPNGAAGLPFASMEAGNGELQVTYIRRKSSSLPGITYSVEFSEILTADSWATNPEATEVVEEIDSTLERVTVIDSAAYGKRFVRVRVSASN